MAPQIIRSPCFEALGFVALATGLCRTPLPSTAWGPLTRAHRGLWAMKNPLLWLFRHLQTWGHTVEAENEPRCADSPPAFWASWEDFSCLIHALPQFCLGLVGWRKGKPEGRGSHFSVTKQRCSSLALPWQRCPPISHGNAFYFLFRSGRNLSKSFLLPARHQGFDPA